MIRIVEINRKAAFDEHAPEFAFGAFGIDARRAVDIRCADSD